MAPRALPIQELRDVASKLKPPLNYEPTEESVGLLSCQVCTNFKPDGIVSHSHCRTMFCVTCVITLIETDSKCSSCNGPIKTKGDVTEFHFPSPNEQYFIDKVKFRCPHCLEDLSYLEATSHPANCQSEPRRTEPPHPNPRLPRGLEAPNHRFEVISNNPRTDTPMRDHRLMIFHHNGVQVAARMFRSDLTMKAVKEKIQRFTGADVSQVQFVKFSHRVLSDQERVGDVAKTDGSTFISSMTGKPDLTGLSLHLLLEELGQPHMTEAQRHEQAQLRAIRQLTRGRPGRLPSRPSSSYVAPEEVPPTDITEWGWTPTVPPENQRPPSGRTAYPAGYWTDSEEEW